MIKPKFSVIIPTYNRVNQIKDAIKSVLEQTLQSFEIIVIDNCSVDNTASLINSFKDIDIDYVDSIEGTCFMYMSNTDAKQCALIAVNEMRKVAYDCDDVEKANYLTDVESELKKL